MDILQVLAGVTGIWLTVSPLVRIKILNTAVIDDLSDYHALVYRMRGTIRETLGALDDLGTDFVVLRNRLTVAHSLIDDARTWSALSKADRLATEALDDAFAEIGAAEPDWHKRRGYRLNAWADYHDAEMIELRRVLERDMEILNRTMVRKLPFAVWLLDLRSYGMSTPMVWDETRKARWDNIRIGGVCITTRPERRINLAS